MLITAETIPDQTPVSNCPANRKEPDRQPNQWLRLEVKKLSYFNIPPGVKAKTGQMDSDITTKSFYFC